MSMELENRMNRKYTEVEDELILESWWNLKQRDDLIKQLGRSKAAVAQRFYALLKQYEIDPKVYRKQMKQQEDKKGAVRKLLGKANPDFTWNSEAEMNLWRWAKQGMDWQTLASKIPGTTPEMCQNHYESLLKQHGMVSTTMGKSEQSSDDLLEALQEFPSRSFELDQRIKVLEAEMASLNSTVKQLLGEFTRGLANVCNLFHNRAQVLNEFDKLKEENQLLREKLMVLEARNNDEKQELRRVYSEIDFWLGEFMQLRKPEKVASLGEIMPRLKSSYERFGALLDMQEDRVIGY
ncbi:MAG: hypothetical protein PHV61_08780 [Limnochordia bacterium]|nr:hypothetical protein [Limnochordia bacterium]MDD4517184.1 hypothetical protein [Limnochordia bacterium]